MKYLLFTPEIEQDPEHYLEGDLLQRKGVFGMAYHPVRNIHSGKARAAAYKYVFTGAVGTANRSSVQSA